MEGLFSNQNVGWICEDNGVGKMIFGNCGRKL